MRIGGLLCEKQAAKITSDYEIDFLMCVCIATSVSARSLAQQRITMQLGETGLKAVFKEISRQTSKTVIYNDAY